MPRACEFACGFARKSSSRSTRVSDVSVLVDVPVVVGDVAPDAVASGPVAGVGTLVAVPLVDGVVTTPVVTAVGDTLPVEFVAPALAAPVLLAPALAELVALEPEFTALVSGFGVAGAPASVRDVLSVPLADAAPLPKVGVLLAVEDGESVCPDEADPGVDGTLAAGAVVDGVVIAPGADVLGRE